MPEASRREGSVAGVHEAEKALDASSSEKLVASYMKSTFEKRYKGISSVLEEELVSLEDRKKSLIQEIDDLDNQKEWVDWISKYGDDIRKNAVYYAYFNEKDQIIEINGICRKRFLNIL